MSEREVLERALVDGDHVVDELRRRPRRRLARVARPLRRRAARAHPVEEADRVALVLVVVKLDRRVEGRRGGLAAEAVGVELLRERAELVVLEVVGAAPPSRNLAGLRMRTTRSSALNVTTSGGSTVKISVSFVRKGGTRPADELAPASSASALMPGGSALTSDPRRACVLASLPAELRFPANRRLQVAVGVGRRRRRRRARTAALPICQPPTGCARCCSDGATTCPSSRKRASTTPR